MQVFYNVSKNGSTKASSGFDGGLVSAEVQKQWPEAVAGE